METENTCTTRPLYCPMNQNTDLSLPALSGIDLHASNPFISSNSAVLLRQLQHLNDFKKKRAGFSKLEDKKAVRRIVKQQYQDDKLRATIREETYTALKANPKQLSGPRSFRLLIGGDEVVHTRERVYDPAIYKFQGHIIHFAGFGADGNGLWINKTWVPSSDVQLSANKMVYTFTANLCDEDGGGVLDGYLNFIAEDTPFGLFIHNNKSTFAVYLQPYASTYTIAVSADAGAEISSSQHALLWDVTSDLWKTASWEKNAGTFALEVVRGGDQFTPIDIVEIGLNDNKSVVPSRAPRYDCTLPADKSPFGYTAVFTQAQDQEVYLSIDIANKDLIPKISSARASSDVKSLFGVQTLIRFDSVGQSFVGAYMDAHQNVYAIQGHMEIPSPVDALSTHFSISQSGIIPDSSGYNDLTQTTKNEPMESTFHSTIPPQNIFSTVTPVQGAFPTLSSADSTLNLSGLLNLSPMKQDTNGQWYDAISRQSMDDLHSGILTFMDDDLFNAFVGGDRPIVTPQIQSILNSDPTANTAFYKGLQVPFLTAALSSSPQSSAQYLNGPRAAKVLRDLPANDPVYKQQSTTFYIAHWIDQYPSIQTYLDDQATVDYSTLITNAGTYLKINLANFASGVPDPDGSQAAALKLAQQDINDLQTWAINNKLYWAFMLYYYAQTYYLPWLNVMMASGALSQNISMDIKTLSAVFAMLEGTAVNPDGKSFQQAFNELVRAFTLTSVLPQFVDAEGSKSDYLEIFNSIINTFVTKYSGVGNTDIQKYVANLTALKDNPQAIPEFMDMLSAVSQETSSLTSWSLTVTKLKTLAKTNNWYNTLASGAGILDGFILATSVVSVAMPFLTGDGWKNMIAMEKVGFVSSMAGLLITLVAKVSSTSLKVVTLWNDIALWTPRAKVFFLGNEQLLDDLAPHAAKKIQIGLTKCVVQTNKTNMELSSSFQVFSSIVWLGRNNSLRIINSLGAILAGVNVYLACIDLAKTTVPIQQTIDILNILSGSCMILGISAGWIATGATYITGTTAAWISATESTATLLGEASVVFAIAGIFVLLVLLMQRSTLPPDPLKAFADQQATAAGLYMPAETQIDYFDIIPPNGTGSLSYDGLTFQSASDQFLQVGPASGTSGTLGEALVQIDASVTYMPDTCFNVQTDSTGNTTIWTTISGANSKATQVCLAVDDFGNLVALPPPSPSTADASGKSVPVDPAVFQKEIQQQQWIFACLEKGASTEIDDVDYLISATFQIQSVSAQQYITVNTATNQVGLSTTAQNWICTMQPIGPGAFSYTVNEWTVYTTSTDESIAPQMDAPGSQPLTWTISPALPVGLELNVDPMQGGAISICEDVTATPSPATNYTVTAGIVINDVQFQQSAMVTISVVVPPVSVPDSSSEA